MKKINLLLAIFILFSVIVGFVSSVKAAYTEETEKELTKIIDKKGLAVAYQGEVEKDKTRWFLRFTHQSQEPSVDQRVMLQITDEKGQPINYSQKDHLQEKEGWLIEQSFSHYSEKQLTLELPKAMKKLHLYIRLDQQTRNGIEELLKQEKPYILEIASEGQSTTTTSRKLETQMNTTELSGTKLINDQSISKTAVDTSREVYNSLYTNKVPQYINDNSGTYPKFSWQPEKQTNVLNHQGGEENQIGWDNVTSWDVTTDAHDQTYIKYGEDTENPNIQLRKYAQQTTVEDEFKIKLNVRGNTTYKPGVDIVFLLDNSDSMNNKEPGEAQNRKAYANEALNKIITELKNVNVPSAKNIRIGAHIFSDYSRNAWGYKPGEVRTFQLSEETSDWDKLNSEYARADSMGGTFTQRGLTEANDLFTDAENSEGRQKLLFVLTDGAPNLSWITKDKGTLNNDMFVDRLHFTNFDKGTKGNYKDGDTLGTSGYKTTIIPPYNGVINSHITTTNSTAMDMKKAGIQIHTIALQLTVNVNETNKRDELLRGLYKMSSKKVNGEQDPDKDTAEDFFFYSVDKGTELTEYYKNWYETIIRTVDKGKINDPLGAMVELVSDEEKRPKVTQVNNGALKIEDDDRPIVSVIGDEIKVENINLTGNQEIEIEYTVRLKTEDPDFVSNHWYQTNQKTTLEPTPERSNDLIEFGSPSVKLQTADFIVPVKKIWLDVYQETEDYWQLRVDEVTATLQKWDKTVWQDIQTVKLNADNDWKTEFSAVKGGSENQYRVIEEGRTNGYMKPSVNQGTFTSETINAEGIEITNELMTGNYSFNKFMEDGKTPFTTDLPKFQITRNDGKIVAKDVLPDSKGKVHFTNIPIGDYLIEESYVPAGFQKMSDFELQVVENDTVDGLSFIVNGSTSAQTVTNKLKDFSLTVEKVDSSDNQLAGASFTLKGPNYEITKTDGPMFSFNNLRPGSYSLTENESPDGYQQLKEPISFEIKIDGTVTIQPHSAVVAKTESNKIELQVMNKKIRLGALPNTGAKGIHLFYLIAGMFVGIGILLSVVYVYFKKV